MLMGRVKVVKDKGNEEGQEKGQVLVSRRESQQNKQINIVDKGQEQEELPVQVRRKGVSRDKWKVWLGVKIKQHDKGQP